MNWVVVGVWIGAVVLAVLVLSFCGYELLWKSRRLQRESLRLRAVTARATALQTEITAMQDRVASAGRA